MNIKGAGSFENAFAEANYLKERVRKPSALSRLAIVLFTTGLGLLVVAFATR